MPGLIDIIALVGAAALLSKATMSSGSDTNESPGSSPAPSTSTTSGTALQNLIDQGLASPNSNVQTVTQTTTQGQTVTFNTVDYNPANPQPGQVVFQDPNDLYRLQGRYIPQVSESLLKSFARAATWADSQWHEYMGAVANGRTAVGIPADFKMKFKDWDYFRTYGGGGTPLTAEQVGLAFDQDMGLEQYWAARDLYLRPKSDDRSLRGLVMFG